MKKRALVILLLGLFTVMAIQETIAYFSDVETSTGNNFVSGNIDLKVDDNCTYNGQPVEECNWQETDLTNQLFFNYSDIKPGDSGENTISLHVYDNPSWVCAEISELKSYENGCNGPEEKVPDTTCGELDGELQNYLIFTVWRDINCNNALDIGEEILVNNQPVAEGSWPISDKNHGNPITQACLGVQWNLPEETGNIIQGDGLTGNVSFYAVQSRNNEDFVCGGGASGGEEDGNGGEEGGGGSGPQPETVCNDGLDNDADTFIDCDDSDCAGSSECDLVQTIMDESFNSYAAGNLSGQDGWTGFSGFEVQSLISKDGGGAIKAGGFGGSSYIQKTGNAAANGKMTICMMKDANDGNTGFNLQQGSSLCTYVRFNQGGQVRIDSLGGIERNFGEWHVNTWHCVEIEWRDSDYSARARLDGGDWSGWWKYEYGTPCVPDTLVLVSGEGGGNIGNDYFDSISKNPLP